MTNDELVLACTLGPNDARHRITAWRDVAAAARTIQPIDGGVRLTLDGSVRPGDLADLAAREVACCSFFSFTLRLADGGTALDVVAPPDARPLVDALLGLDAVEGTAAQ